MYGRLFWAGADRKHCFLCEGDNLYKHSSSGDILIYHADSKILSLVGVEERAASRKESTFHLAIAREKSITVLAVDHRTAETLVRYQVDDLRDFAFVTYNRLRLWRYSSSAYLLEELAIETQQPTKLYEVAGERSALCICGEEASAIYLPNEFAAKFDKRHRNREGGQIHVITFVNEVFSIITDYGSNLTAMAFSPDLKFAAVGTELGEVYVLSFEKIRLAMQKSVRATLFSEMRFHWHSSDVAAMIFSNDGSTLYSGGNESVVCEHNLNSGEISRKFVLDLCPIVWISRVKSDSNVLYVSFSDMETIELDTSSSHTQLLNRGLTFPVTSVRFFLMNKRLVDMPVAASFSWLVQRYGENRYLSTCRLPDGSREHMTHSGQLKLLDKELKCVASLWLWDTLTWSYDKYGYKTRNALVDFRMHPSTSRVAIIQKQNCLSSIKSNVIIGSIEENNQKKPVFTHELIYTSKFGQISAICWDSEDRLIAGTSRGNVLTICRKKYGWSVSPQFAFGSHITQIEKLDSGILLFLLRGCAVLSSDLSLMKMALSYWDDNGIMRQGSVSSSSQIIGQSKLEGFITTDRHNTYLTLKNNSYLIQSEGYKFMKNNAFGETEHCSEKFASAFNSNHIRIFKDRICIF